MEADSDWASRAVLFWLPPPAAAYCWNRAAAAAAALNGIPPGFAVGGGDKRVDAVAEEECTEDDGDGNKRESAGDGEAPV